MLADPPGAPLTLQITAVLAVLLTVALNCCVAPRMTTAEPGETTTLTGGGFGGGLGELDPPPTPAQPAARTIVGRMMAKQMRTREPASRRALGVLAVLASSAENTRRPKAIAVPPWRTNFRTCFLRCTAIPKSNSYEGLVHCWGTKIAASFAGARPRGRIQNPAGCFNMEREGFSFGNCGASLRSLIRVN